MLESLEPLMAAKRELALLLSAFSFWKFRNLFLKLSRRLGVVMIELMVLSYFFLM